MAAAPQAGPDLLTELAEVERTPAQVLADAVESVRTSDEPEWAAMGRRIGRQTAQQLADAETAARRLDQAQRFITPAGEIKTVHGADVTPERVQRMCADGAWSRNPETGLWSCAECGKPAAAPVLAEIEALQDDAPGQLVEVDLPPLQPRARWQIEGASSEVPKPEVPQVNLTELMVGVDALHAERRAAGWPSGEAPACSDGGDCGCPPEAVRLCPGRDPDDLTDDDPGPAFPGADCDCLGDGDLHPPGSGGCLVTSDAVERLLEEIEPEDFDQSPDQTVAAYAEAVRDARPVETVASAVVDHLLGDDPEPRETGLQHGPAAFGPPWATSAGPLARPRITLPGVYHLTDDEYHDPAVTGAWVSNSDLKAMTVDGCPAQWRYDRDNGVTDDREVYLFGKAVHAEVLGKGSSVVVRPAEWSDWRKAAARAWKAEQLAAGLVPVTPEEAETARAMAAAVHADPVAAEALSRPGRPEVAMFWREQLPSGRWVQRRGMVDYLTDDGDPIDFKTAESANPNERMERAIYEYGYHRQAVTYEAAIVALDLSPTYPKMLFLFQQKKAPYLVTPVELDDRAAVVGEGETRAALEIYAECVESGVWPGYGKAIMTIPEYRGREFDEEMT